MNLLVVSIIFFIIHEIVCELPTAGHSKILILTENDISIPKTRTIVHMIISLFPWRRLPDGAWLQSGGTCPEDNFHVWVERMSPYPLVVDMRARPAIEFSSILASGFCIGGARNWLIHLLSCLPFTYSSPSSRFVLSRSNHSNHSFISGSTALCWALASSSVS
jgi:hypothetical protein